MSVELVATMMAMISAFPNVPAKYKGNGWTDGATRAAWSDERAARRRCIVLE